MNDEPTNHERSQRIDAVMNAYQQSLGRESAEAGSQQDYLELGSLLVDMMHWCDLHNVDFTKAMCLAKSHHMAERNPLALLPS